MRLIDADAAKRIICQDQCELPDGCGGSCEMTDYIEDTPTVEPVRHGHWIKVSGYITPGGDPLWKCSECGKGLHLYGVEHGSYGSDVADSQWVACPNCGAKMDEVSE